MPTKKAQLSILTYSARPFTLFKIDEGRLKVRARVYFDYTIDYKNYKDEVKTTNSDSSAYITLAYDYFEENFKLYDVDNLVTYFSTR